MRGQIDLLLSGPPMISNADPLPTKQTAQEPTLDFLRDEDSYACLPLAALTEAFASKSQLPFLFYFLKERKNCLRLRT